VRQGVAAGRVPDAASTAQGDRLHQRFRESARALVEGLDADVRTGGGVQRAARLSVLTTALAGSAAAGVVLILLALRIVRLSLDPMRALAALARRIAAGQHVGIPRDLGSAEVAELASALRAWQETSAVRGFLADQAPVGVCRLDNEGRVLRANPALEVILGRRGDQLVGRFHSDLLYPGHYAADPLVLNRLRQGQSWREATELRYLRPDSTSVWCSVAMSSLLHHDGTPDGYLAIVEDIGARRAETERAARIQRSLLPREVPRLPGYELAGMCRPAEDVAGDFYDWVVTPNGQLDLTVADVMGKGIGAALVMATLRAALRTAPAELGPGERLRLAARSMALGSDDEGLFVTVFQGRLDLETGELRYVDAGHGYCVVRRRGGQFASLPERSLPVGVAGDFREGVMTLEPGDTLVVHSDGLVEVEEQVGDLRAFSADLEQAVDAERMVHRLSLRMPGRLPDDVTLVVLRRLAERPLAAGPAGRPAEDVG